MYDNFSSFDDFFGFDNSEIYGFKNHKFKSPKPSDDVISFSSLEGKHSKNDAWLNLRDSDVVNSPKHYTHGRVEAIEVIEDAIDNAPSTTTAFYLGQTLKYLLRLWHKGNPKQDAEKARWYLNKLIDKLS